MNFLKKPNNYDGMIPLKIDASDVRHVSNGRSESQI